MAYDVHQVGKCGDAFDGLLIGDWGRDSDAAMGFGACVVGYDDQVCAFQSGAFSGGGDAESAGSGIGCRWLSLKRWQIPIVSVRRQIYWRLL